MKCPTTAVVWRLMCEGCNAAEIAAYWHIAPATAVALMAAAARKAASGPKREKLRRAA